MAVFTPTSTDLRVLDRARAKLELGWSEIGEIIGVNESTVHRWRSGTSTPRPMALSRIAQFGELLDLLTRLFAGPDLAREWLSSKKPESLGGHATPLEVMREGRLDRVLTLLHFLARGA
jgi:transcriptional regulator with XRE-family HTH domain